MSIPCAMDPSREEIADRELKAADMEIRATARVVSLNRRAVWVSTLTKFLDDRVEEFNDWNSDTVQEIANLRSEISELRQLVSALEERVECRSRR